MCVILGAAQVRDLVVFFPDILIERHILVGIRMYILGRLTDVICEASVGKTNDLPPLRS